MLSKIVCRFKSSIIKFYWKFPNFFRRVEKDFYFLAFLKKLICVQNSARKGKENKKGEISSRDATFHHCRSVMRIRWTFEIHEYLCATKFDPWHTPSHCETKSRFLSKQFKILMKFFYHEAQKVNIQRPGKLAEISNSIISLHFTLISVIIKGN